MAIVTIIQTFANGWKKDKDDSAQLRQDYDKVLRDYYEMKMSVDDIKFERDKLRKQVDELAPLALEVAKLRKRLDDTIRFGEKALDRLEQEAYTNKDDKN